MKIAIINSVCGYGSTGRIMRDLAETYMQAGHECILAYGRGTVLDADRQELLRKFQGHCTFYRIGGRMAKLNNDIHGIESRLWDHHGFSSRLATKWLVEYLRREKPEVLHLHNLHGYYVNVEQLFRYIKEEKPKVIWTLHDCWSYTGHCSYYDYVKCFQWEKGCQNCPQKKEYPGSILWDRSAQNYVKKKAVFTGVPDLTLVTPSEWLKEQLQRSFLKSYPAVVIKNGIDLHTFSEAGRSLTQKTDKELLEGSQKIAKRPQAGYTVLGVASVWTKRKGIRYFVSLAKHLPENYNLQLVGLSVKQCQELEERKKQIPYLQKITGILRTASVEELAEYYRSADVYVNPTLEDNFPTTNLEALASGTPVVTFRTGGSPECLATEQQRDQKIFPCGIVVPKEDTKGLCHAVRKICEAPADIREKQRMQCAAWAKNYEKNDRYQEYLKLL